MPPSPLERERPRAPPDPEELLRARWQSWSTRRAAPAAGGFLRSCAEVWEAVRSPPGTLVGESWRALSLSSTDEKSRQPLSQPQHSGGLTQAPGRRLGRGHLLLWTLRPRPAALGTGHGALASQAAARTQQQCRQPPPGQADEDLGTGAGLGFQDHRRPPRPPRRPPTAAARSGHQRSCARAALSSKFNTIRCNSSGLPSIGKRATFSISSCAVAPSGAHLGGGVSRPPPARSPGQRASPQHRPGRAAAGRRRGSSSPRGARGRVDHRPVVVCGPRSEACSSSRLARTFRRTGCRG